MPGILCAINGTVCWVEVQLELGLIGWDEANWNEDLIPWENTLCWNQISPEVRDVLTNLCYDEDTWDTENHCGTSAQKSFFIFFRAG